MTKLHKKLLVIVGVIICSFCLCFGLAACNPNNSDNTNDDNSGGGGHTHTFEGFWLFDGADGHYQLATCHPEVKSELEPHIDENGDFICDVCDYIMHVHVDEDEDNICDECQTVLHKHTFEEEWTFNENKHWHIATCEHFVERENYEDHSFVNGVCECGINESEVKVYALYKISPEYQLFFVQWLDWLKDEGITVEYTDSGDGVYHYSDGHSEVRFLGNRTVKVKAEADGEPLAYVWIMISLYDRDNEGYIQVDGTIALGIAETDESGIAEIVFSPVGGYSSDTKEYRVRIAEAKDIAFLQGVAEEDASRPIPNRYEVKGGQDGFEYMSYEVSENGNSEEIAVTIEFNYSIGWNAYNTFALSYHRYFEDLINGEGIKEEGFTCEFTTSGGNLFDYFTFSPAKYSFASSGSVEDSAKIEENAKLAAAGIYKISFTVEGDATAELYYWNEEGVNLGAFHYTNSDGTPANMYLTAQSGGTAGNGKYTGGSFVEVKIAPSLGLRLYQLGIKTDVECKVTITVERIDDFGVGADYTFNWDESGISQLTIDLPQADILTFALNGYSEGLYVLAMPEFDTTSFICRFYAWTDTDEQKIYVWQPRYWEDVRGLCRVIIRITDSTNFIFLQNTSTLQNNVTITLEKYELPTVKADEFASLPVSSVTGNTHYEAPLEATAGSYTLKVWIGGYQEVGGADYPLSVYIGNTLFTLEKPSVYTTGTPKKYYYTYTGTITVGEQDGTISMRCCTLNLFIAGIQISKIAG